MTNIRKGRFPITKEGSAQAQTVNGYEISILIPEWNKNRQLLKDVKKTHTARDEIFTKLTEGQADRAWVMERFAEIDKGIARALGEISRRIRTRRRRESGEDSSLGQLKEIFGQISHCCNKSISYCGKMGECETAEQRSILLDALSMNVVRVGEHINSVERMQNGFWEKFGTIRSFVEMRDIRHQLVHASELTENEMKHFVMGKIPRMVNIIQNTYFSEADTPESGKFLIPTAALRGLPAAKGGDPASPELSVGGIYVDSNGEFIVVRFGRGDRNQILVSSSVVGPMQLKVYGLKTSGPTSPNESTR